MTPDDGARLLGDALQANNSLTSLSLDYNEISDIGAYHLSRGIESNLTLEILDLDANQIGKTNRGIGPKPVLNCFMQKVTSGPCIFPEDF